MVNILGSAAIDIPFLKGLEPVQLQTILGCASNATFEGGKFIFREGEVANHFYIVTRGSVSLEVYAPGRGPITVETLESGDVLGWSWLFPPYRWHFDARATELTRAIAFDAHCLRDKCEMDHDLGYELVKRFSNVITARLQATRLRLLDLYGSTPVNTMSTLK